MEPKYTPQETAQRVLDQVRMHPETHDQRFWNPLQARIRRFMDGEPKPECGTVMCIGGWAAKINDVSLKLDHFQVARDLLGLNDDEADALFYTMDNASAIHALEYLAKGEQIDWEAVHDAGWGSTDEN